MNLRAAAWSAGAMIRSVIVIMMSTGGLPTSGCIGSFDILSTTTIRPLVSLPADTLGLNEQRM
jgi:hypothetical protein